MSINWKKELITLGIMVLMFITGWLISDARNGGFQDRAELYEEKYHRAQADLQVNQLVLNEIRQRAARERLEQIIFDKRRDFYVERNVEGAHKLKEDYVTLQSDYMMLRMSIPEKLKPILPPPPQWYADLINAFNKKQLEEDAPEHVGFEDRRIGPPFIGRLESFDLYNDKKSSFWHLSEILARMFPAPMKMPKNAD